MGSVTSNHDSFRTRRRALLSASILAAPLLLGALIQTDGARASLFGLEGPTCPVGATLGTHACPGCGLTRSAALAVQGDLDASFVSHPAGWIVVLLCAIGFVLYADILRRGARTNAHTNALRLGRWTFVAAIGAAWIGRLAWAAA